MTSNFETANGRAIVTSICSASRSAKTFGMVKRARSAGVDPSRAWPAGTTTISGQSSWQSRKVVPGGFASSVRALAARLASSRAPAARRRAAGVAMRVIWPP